MSQLSAEQEKALQDKLLDEIEAVVKANIPSDMNAENILAQMRLMTQIIGVTRSRVMAAAVFYSLYAQVIGLDGEDVQKTVAGILATVKADPRTAGLAADYAVKNAQAKQQAASYAEMTKNFGAAVGVSHTIIRAAIARLRSNAADSGSRILMGGQRFTAQSSSYSATPGAATSATRSMRRHTRRNSPHRPSDETA